MTESAQTFLGAKLYKGASASAWLYLTWSCADWIDDGSLIQLSPTVFRCNGTVIVIRHLSGLRAIPQHDKLIYVIDDDWRSGLSDASLPVSYRLQLATEFLRTVPKIEKQANVILTASARLALQYRERYPSSEVAEIEPAWPEATAPLPNDTPQTLAFLSAGTHRADARFLVPVLESVFGKHPDLQLTVSHPFDVPIEWTRKWNVIKLPQMGWNTYRQWMRNEHFDVLLYPLMDTPFNAKRSANKLHESDQLGAALISSETWQAGRNAAEMGRCAVRKNAQSQWIDGILDILETPGGANSLAAKNRSAFTVNTPLFSQKSLWSALLNR